MYIVYARKIQVIETRLTRTGTAGHPVRKQMYRNETRQHSTTGRLRPAHENRIEPLRSVEEHDVTTASETELTVCGTIYGRSRLIRTIIDTTYRERECFGLYTQPCFRLCVYVCVCHCWAAVTNGSKDRALRCATEGIQSTFVRTISAIQRMDHQMPRYGGAGRGKGL